MNGKFYGIMLLCFALVSGGAYALAQTDPRYDFRVLMTGNFLMFGISVITFMMSQKSVKDRPQAFVRGVFSGTMVRLFVCMGALVVYAVVNKEHLFKGQVFALFGIYAIYSAIETILVSKMAKEVK